MGTTLSDECVNTVFDLLPQPKHFCASCIVHVIPKRVAPLTKICPRSQLSKHRRLMCSQSYTCEFCVHHGGLCRSTE